MKIAFYGKYAIFHPYRPGGIESWVRRMGLFLKEQGHTIHYILYDAPKTREEIIEGLPLYLHNRGKEAQARMRKGMYHLLITQNLPGRHALSLWRCKQQGTKLLRMHFFAKELSPLRICTLRLYQAFFHHNLTISPGLGACMEREGLQVPVLLPPVPGVFFAPKNKKLGNPLIITYMGRIAPEKGLEKVITAFTALKTQYGERVQPRIIGYSIPQRMDSMALHERLQKQEAIQYEHFSRQAASIREDLLAQHLLASHCMVLPYQSLQGTLELPYLFLEAMAALNIIITTDLGSLGALIPNREFLLSPQGSAGDLIGTLQSLLNRDLEKEKHRVLAKREELGFSMEETANTFLQIINPR